MKEEEAVQIFRADNGDFTLFEARSDLMSKKLAKETDEVVAIRALVSAARKAVVSIPINRQILDNVDSEVLLLTLEDQARRDYRALCDAGPKSGPLESPPPDASSI